MALVKASRSGGHARRAMSSPEIAAGLRSPDPAQRRDAIRQIADQPDARQLSETALQVETDAANIELLIAFIPRLGAAVAAEVLGAYLASIDPTKRNRAVEALQLLGPAAAGAVATALRDSDEDVRIQALAVVPFLDMETAQRILIDLLSREPDPNVCNCAIEALVELGDPRALPVLADLKRRFPGESLLQFSADLAIDRIGDQRKG